TKCFFVASANPAAHLVQIAQTKIIGIINKNGIGIGHIQTTFYNRGTYQYIKCAIHKCQHELFQFFAIHLPVANTNFGVGYQPLNQSSYFFNIFYTVVYKEYLPAPLDFITNSVPYRFFVKANYMAFNGVSIWRWRCNNR